MCRLSPLSMLSHAQVKVAQTKDLCKVRMMDYICINKITLVLDMEYGDIADISVCIRVQKHG